MMIKMVNRIAKPAFRVCLLFGGKSFATWFILKETDTKTMPSLGISKKDQKDFKKLLALERGSKLGPGRHTSQNLALSLANSHVAYRFQ